MNRFYHLFMLLSLLTTSCVTPVRFLATFSIATLDTAHQVAAQDAAQQWCDVTDGACCPHLTTEVSGQPLDEVLEVRGPDGSLRPGAGGTTWIMGPMNRLEIHVLAGLDLGIFQLVVRHELGHACRAQAIGVKYDQSSHLPAGNVMGANTGNQPQLPTEADIKYAQGE